MTIAEQIQHEIIKSGEKPLHIATDAGLAPGTFHRVQQAGWGQQLDTAEKVLGALGKELRIVRRKNR